MSAKIPFNVPPVLGPELRNVEQAISGREFAGNGAYTQRCQALLREQLGVCDVLLTHSCTAALEMAALLAELGPGDEVIMPSYTFVSTANAVVLRGAVPVFIDIRPDTLNIDEFKIEEAVTPRTRAIFAVHYAGVCAEMDKIATIARSRDLLVVEDAAQAIKCTYRGVPAGRLGDMGCFSFHATKNVVCGEGGAFVTRDAAIAERAHIVWEKGTNRREFLAGNVDKYTWIDIGSSFLPSEFTAAFLLAQLDQADRIMADRLNTWDRYHTAFAELERRGLALRPTVPEHCRHNGHMYYLILPTKTKRDAMIGKLAADGITATSHYVPLHSSPAGRKYGRTDGDLSVTDDMSGRLVRLPLYYGLGDRVDEVVDRVIVYASHGGTGRMQRKGAAHA